MRAGQNIHTTAKDNADTFLSSAGVVSNMNGQVSWLEDRRIRSAFPASMLRKQASG